MSHADEIKKVLENHKDILGVVSEYFKGHVQEQFAKRFLKSFKSRRVASRV